MKNESNKHGNRKKAKRSKGKIEVQKKRNLEKLKKKCEKHKGKKLKQENEREMKTGQRGRIERANNEK
jgi:hypothetical protein